MSTLSEWEHALLEYFESTFCKFNPENGDLLTILEKDIDKHLEMLKKWETQHSIPPKWKLYYISYVNSVSNIVSYLNEKVKEYQKEKK